LLVKGNLTVNGTTTTVKSNVVEISDKAINLAAVVSVQFSCSVANGSANITAISPTLGLIPGMEVVSNTVGITIPSSTTIVSISGNTAVLSNNVTGTGTATFSAIGPSDTAADGGGIIVNGTTNKNFLWENDTDAWTSSEHMDLAAGKQYRINNVLIASSTQIGPSSGAFGLGAGVLTSSLTSVGTLTSLTVSGDIVVGSNSSRFAENNLRFKSAGGAFIDHNTIGQDINFRLSNASALDKTPLVVKTAGIEPGADATYDLGASNKRWANVYSADLQLSNEGSANDVDGTWGQYTIQEGEEDLFLINRRNGKKYKFMLQEVN
jgi:hypothetical protein